ncbi:A disintegrin and metalloproteinase with thrombospondin motifs 8 [Protopterus annectens]|uniref:A disintegrin and metalloproteinase with thrombospondin motifs 8 n=1 Tax=Protopterus annectens TaxID=7888 RepID=UPI001CFC3DCB|nr:A disintegrin and metalloproteinase with thrombospondin motifs 8 [Protopterus annectens]
MSITPDRLAGLPTSGGACFRPENVYSSRGFRLSQLSFICLLIVSFTPLSIASHFQHQEIVLPVKVRMSRKESFGTMAQNLAEAIQISALGKNFVLQLFPDDSFLAPELQIQHIGGGNLGSARQQSRAGVDDSVPAEELGHSRSRFKSHRKDYGWSVREESDRNRLGVQLLQRDKPEGQGPKGSRPETINSMRHCFYSGQVNKDHDSFVAVSLCGGIHGSFVYEGIEYLIEPISPGHQNDHWSSTQLHQLQRRTEPIGSEIKDWRSDSRVRTVTGQQDSEPKRAIERTQGLSWEQTLAGKLGVVSDAQDVPATRKNLQGRARRFVSEPRFVETLVAADPSMLQFYGDELQHHILTLMSIVARLYKHPSLGNSVNLVVVKLLIVEDENVGLTVSNNGGLTLRSFCNWQRNYNPPSDRHPEHYDTAILLTRKDICGYQSCRTLGMADIGTMCDLNRSCSVIEDDGLQAAYTAAHELGHVFSMPHDDSRTCVQRFGDLGKYYMMASLFVQLNKTSPWSPCSAFYITEFFNNGHGDCLLDAPTEYKALPSSLPGLAPTYSLDRQCQQIFGEDYEYCTNTTDLYICSQLWCRQEGQPQCVTQNSTLPWIDGTTCGHNMLCRDGLCMHRAVALQPKLVVDGNWGHWGPWEQCSRICGGGVHLSHRACDDPEPQNGGKYCEGQRTRYQSCNMDRCPNENGVGFRQQQCAKYNKYNFTDLDGNIVEWIPKHAGLSPRDRCKLICRARGKSEFKVFETKVIDGTLCSPDSTSVCVQGQCIKAGCDQVIGSSKKQDKCGVCGGNGTSCRKISGSLNKAKYGYSDIVTIPAGATNLDIKQRSPKGVKHDGIYLALKTMDGSYILNGNFSISTMEQDIPVKGAVLRYSGSSTFIERIQSFQQLQEPVTIQLLAVSSETSPPRIKYTFFLPKDVPFSKQKSSDKKSPFVAFKQRSAPDWVSEEWSACSKSCGSGWQRRTVECRDEEGNVSTECERALRLEDIRPCGDVPCPLWQLGPWSSCSQTCGSGIRRRSALCMDYLGRVTEATKCPPSKEPTMVTETCSLPEC